MSFKMKITRIETNGKQEIIEVENSEALTDQAQLFTFLNPLVQGGILTYEELLDDSHKDADEAMHEAYQQLEKAQETEDPLVRDYNEPAGLEKVEIEVPKRETGVVLIHCPSCGLETAKHTPIKAEYIKCPTCKKKLYLYSINQEKRGEPDIHGNSFKANNIYQTQRERWEQKHGKA